MRRKLLIRRHFQNEINFPLGLSVLHCTSLNSSGTMLIGMIETFSPKQSNPDKLSNTHE